MRSRHSINCIDVIMGAMASQITSLTIVYSTVYSCADQRKHLSPTSPAFVRGIHRDRWIPRTNGQLRGKCFHLMTSSCLTHFFFRSVTKDKPFANLQSHENSFEELAKWREVMTPSNGTFSALLALCAGNSPVTGEFSAQSDAELWSKPEETVEQTFVRLVIWDAVVLIMTSLYWKTSLALQIVWNNSVKFHWCESCQQDMPLRLPLLKLHSRCVILKS